MRFNIAGAYSKSIELRKYIFENKEVLKKFDITVYDGINNCAWNGGRINRDITFDDAVTDFYYRNGISIALVFTNPVIDLTDETGNMLLKKFHRLDNVIISTNLQLLQYVKQHYPLYKHTRSITSFGKISVPMSDDDYNQYKELQSLYDYIVPRCEHVFDDRFVLLDQTKYEIMLNDTCLYNCPYYGEHFAKIAEQNRKYTKPWIEGGAKNMHEIEECWLPKFNPDVGHMPTIKKLGDNYGMELKHSQICKLIAQGITNFKITGREMTYENFNHELNLYLKDVYK